ncbi:uncharacterized protein LOC143860940 [Tasmannia lanceolata]|uniref:uncharacterized protein LOC143860940 n=1 Tax=Tasmannia lanceolata TaxID=3420 RepID=UPI004064103A
MDPHPESSFISSLVSSPGQTAIPSGKTTSSSRTHQSGIQLPGFGPPDLVSSAAFNALLSGSDLFLTSLNQAHGEIVSNTDVLTSSASSRPACVQIKDSTVVCVSDQFIGSPDRGAEGPAKLDLCNYSDPVILSKEDYDLVGGKVITQNVSRSVASSKDSPSGSLTPIEAKSYPPISSNFKSTSKPLSSSAPFPGLASGLGGNPSLGSQNGAVKSVQPCSRIQGDDRIPNEAKPREGKNPINPWRNFFAESAPSPISTNLDHIIPETSEKDSLMLHFDDEVVIEHGKKWANCLIGFFIGKKPFFISMREALNRKWNLKGTLEMFAMDHGFFLFKFSSEEDCTRILEEDGHNYGRRPLILQRWDPNTLMERKKLSEVPVWIKIWTSSGEINQQIDYDWKPNACSYCMDFSHSSESCHLHVKHPQI